MRTVWVLICLVSLAGIVSAAPPPPPPPNPEIAYVQTGTKQKIVVMNSDGSNKTTPFTGVNGEVLSEPALSPGAQWVAFTSPSRGLVVVDRITKVATVLMTPAQCGASAPRLPNDPGFCWNPRFSPSGSRVAVLDGGLSAPRVWSIPSSGGTPVVLYSGSQGTPFFDVAWDSDESQIAIVELVDAAPNRIIVVNLATGTPRTIVDGLDLFSIDWARNGLDRIIFDALIAGGPDRNIYTVDFSDTGADPPVLVTAGQHPSYSPDNGSIVYRRNGNQARIDKRNLMTGVVTENLATDLSPDWKR